MESDIQVWSGAGDHCREGGSTELTKLWRCIISTIMYLENKHSTMNHALLDLGFGLGLGLREGTELCKLADNLAN